MSGILVLGHAAHVPFIKTWFWTGKATKMGARDVFLDFESRDPLASDADFQATSKATGNRDREARGIPDFLLDYPHANRKVTSTVVLCGCGRDSSALDMKDT